MATKITTVQYEGLAAIEKALSDPNYVLRRRSTVLASGGKISLEDAFRLAQQGREGLLYAASN
jgi:hypothetical protein